MFAVTRAALWPALPYDSPSRLALIWHGQGDTPGVVGVSPADFTTYRDHARAFSHVAAATTRGYNLSGEPAPLRVTCARVTPGLWPLLGVPAQRGRTFAAAEDEDGLRVVVLSQALWRARFAARLDIVGQHIRLDGLSYEVIGVMPAGFVFPVAGLQGLDEAACWLPASFSPAEMATPSFDFVLFGRLAPGRSFAQASEDASVQARRIWRTYPAAVQAQIDLRARVVPLREQLATRSRTAVWLFAASALLLHRIACANAANLLLTGAPRRRRGVTQGGRLVQGGPSVIERTLDPDEAARVPDVGFMAPVSSAELSGNTCRGRPRPVRPDGRCARSSGAPDITLDDLFL